MQLLLFCCHTSKFCEETSCLALTYSDKPKVCHFPAYNLQREYEEFKVRINALVFKAQKVPEEGWTMQDGTPWPGNNPRDHPGMIQVHLDTCFEIQAG